MLPGQKTAHSIPESITEPSPEMKRKRRTKDREFLEKLCSAYALRKGSWCFSWSGIKPITAEKYVSFSFLLF